MPEAKEASVALGVNPKITHCLFDMDGLLLDTERYYSKAFENICERYDRRFTWESKLFVMGKKLSEIATPFLEMVGIPLEADDFLKKFDQECVEVFQEPVPIMPGALELVQHLHKHNIPIALATSSKRFTFEKKTKPHPQLFSLFRHVVIASEDPEIQEGKPHPQTFLVCASRFETPPKSMSDCLVFEDSVAGVQSGNSAGAYTVWVPDSRMDRALVNPHVTLDTLEHFRPEHFGLPAF